MLGRDSDPEVSLIKFHREKKMGVLLYLNPTTLEGCVDICGRTLDLGASPGCKHPVKTKPKEQQHRESTS